jgi:hypothetical protein
MPNLRVGRDNPRNNGAVAQLGERRVRNAEVVGSNPIGSTGSNPLSSPSIIH